MAKLQFVGDQLMRLEELNDTNWDSNSVVVVVLLTMTLRGEGGVEESVDKV